MKRSILSFDISTRDEAQRATRIAAYAGWIAAGLSLFLLFAVDSRTELVARPIDVWALGEIVLMAALAFGTYRGNRYAAVGLLGLFTLEQVAIRVESGWVTGLLITALFFLLFVKGVRGAFFLHGTDPEDELVAQVAALEASVGITSSSEPAEE